MEKPHCAQSPINVVPTVFSRNALELSLHWSPANGTPTWTSSGLKVSFEVDPENYIVLGTVKFFLDSFHFHHPSEHHTNGKKFPAELHIVHKTQVAGKDRAVVFAIFLTLPPRVARHPDRAFFAALKAISGKLEGDLSVPLNPIEWLPSRTETAIRYEGSLTTDDFEENVSWVVLGEVPIIKLQYDYIFNGTAPHARPLQSLNRRFVVQYPWKPKEYMG